MIGIAKNEEFNESRDMLLNPGNRKKESPLLRRKDPRGLQMRKILSLTAVWEAEKRSVIGRV